MGSGNLVQVNIGEKGSEVLADFSTAQSRSVLWIEWLLPLPVGRVLNIGDIQM